MSVKTTSLLAVAAVAALVLVACGDESARPGAPPPNEAPSLPIAADAAALRPPGTELAPGVVVQDGSWLVGTAFPDARAVEASSSGWQAVLLIDGEPAAVWDRYAEALGIDDRAGSTQACVVMQVGAPRPPAQDTSTTMLTEFDEAPPTRFLTEERLDGENRLRCETVLGSVEMVLGHGAARIPPLECAGARPGEAATCSYAAESHLFIRVGRESDEYGSLGTRELRFNRTWQAAALAGGSVGDTPTEDMWIPIPSGPVIAPRFHVDTTRSRLPLTGERLDDGLDSFLGPGWTVPDGGRSLMAPAQVIECNSGLVAVLDVRGEPSAALATLDDADRHDDDAVTAEGTDPQGRRWAASYIGSAGGHHLEAVAVPGPDGSSIVLITECGD